MILESVPCSFQNESEKNSEINQIAHWIERKTASSHSTSYVVSVSHRSNVWTETVPRNIPSKQPSFGSVDGEIAGHSVTSKLMEIAMASTFGSALNSSLNVSFSNIVSKEVSLAVAAGAHEKSE